MSRTRPIKLHMKDGKPSSFRLIGPKGRVLNTLQWDGESLDLKDALSGTNEMIRNDVETPIPGVEEAQEEAEVIDKILDMDEEDTQSTTRAPPPPVSAGPEPIEDTKAPVDEDVEVIEDVSGEDEIPEITDEGLDEILAEERKPEDETNFKVDANIPGNPKEPSGWLTKGKDKVAVMAMEDEPDDDAIARVLKKHQGYDVSKGPKEPEDKEEKDDDAAKHQKDETAENKEQG